MRFGIRDLLWLTVVVALGVGWWIDWNARADQRLTLWLSEHSYPPRSHNEPHQLKVSNPIRANFTIRDLFWLTAVAALGIGWWVDHRRLLVEIANCPIRKALEADDHIFGTPNPSAPAPNPPKQ